MVNLESIARAALSGDSLLLRSLTQDWLRTCPRVSECSQPRTQDADVLIVAAALVELFADRLGQPAPAWTGAIGPMRAPRFLVAAAARLKRLRELCERESPDPLRRRNLFAPPNFLQFA